MSLIVQENIKPSGEFGIWYISETRDFFLQQLDLTKEEEERYARMKGKMQIEWLAARYLLHKLSGRRIRGKLHKNEYGKPYLDGSAFHISLSHSKDMAAVIASPLVCGIDIQLIVPKIERISKKFMSQSELDDIDNNKIIHMHIVWGAKECLYKSYGKKKLDFKKHIFIDTFKLQGDSGSFTGSVKKDDFDKRYQLCFRRYGDYMLVYSTQLEDDA
jgi:phosphopantetheinyl transferase